MTFDERFPKGNYPEELRRSFQEIWNMGEEEYKQKVREAFEFSDEWWEDIWQNDRDLNDIVKHVKDTVFKELVS